MDYRKRLQKPWVVKIEFTRGCNLSCEFCPIHYNAHMRDPAKREYLIPDMCDEIAWQLLHEGYEGRIELTMRGEPTLSPFLLDNLKVIKHRLPKVQVALFSNGVMFLKEPRLILDVLDAGANLLCIDCYGSTYDRFTRLVHAVKQEHLDNLLVRHFPDFQVYKKYGKGYEFRTVVLIPDTKDGVGVKQVHNMAGNVPDEYVTSMKHSSFPLTKTCTRAFRELAITNDGDVIMCCHDWSKVVVFGNVMERGLWESWYSKERWELLCRLYNKDRDFQPCAVCDYFGGYRVGLLQNPFVDKEIV